MTNVQRYFDNPDPRIRALTGALLRIVPVTKPTTSRRSIAKEAERRIAEREANPIREMGGWTQAQSDGQAECFDCHDVRAVCCDGGLEEIAGSTFHNAPRCAACCPAHRPRY